jgi:hypothetical protein
MIGIMPTVEQKEDIEQLMDEVNRPIENLEDKNAWEDHGPAE